MPCDQPLYSSTILIAAYLVNQVPSGLGDALWEIAIYTLLSAANSSALWSGTKARSYSGKQPTLERIDIVLVHVFLEQMRVVL